MVRHIHSPSHTLAAWRSICLIGTHGCSCAARCSPLGPKCASNSSRYCPATAASPTTCAL